jgi:LysM repeat protein
MKMKPSVYKLLFAILFFLQCNSAFGREDIHYIYHIVASGENVYRISLRYSVNRDSIRKWNNLDQNYTVLIGQRLFVNGSNSAATDIKPSPDKGLVQIPDTSKFLTSAPSLVTARKINFLPLYSESLKVKSSTTFYNTLIYYYRKSNILFDIILVLNLVFILSVLLLLIVILIRRLMHGYDAVKRKECQDRYWNFIARWLYDEHTGEFPGSLKKELEDKVYRDFFTSELLSLHANLTGESAEKLVLLFHLSGLKKYSILKVHHLSWHVKAKGFRELAQMKIADENDVISTYLNSKNTMLQIEAQLAWIQLNPGDPLSFLDDPDIRLTEWALLNSLHSLKKIDKIPDFGRWLKCSNKSVTLFAIKMTGIFKQFDNVEMVAQRLRDIDPDIRYEAIKSLGEMGIPSPVSGLQQLFPGEELVNKSEIVRSLMMIADSQNIPFFDEVLGNETDLNFRILAAKGLVSLNGLGKERLDLIYEQADPVLKKIIIHAKDDRI